MNFSFFTACKFIDLMKNTTLEEESLVQWIKPEKELVVFENGVAKVRPNGTSTILKFIFPEKDFKQRFVKNVSINVAQPLCLFALTEKIASDNHRPIIFHDIRTIISL